MTHTAIQIVVISHDRPANKLLSRWLARQGVDWRYSSYDYDVGEVRCQAVTRFLEEDVPRGKTHLLLIDDDMVPVEGSDAILTADGDMIYLGTSGPFGTHGHYGDGDWGENFCRMSADLLRRMAYPFFKTQYRRGVRVACDGAIFRTQAEVLGVTSKMVGLAGHQQQCILVPQLNGTAVGYAVKWPHEIDREQR